MDHFFFRTSHSDSHELMKKFADSDFIKKVPKYAKIGVDHVYKTVSDLEISLNKKAHFDVKFVWNPCQFFFYTSTRCIWSILPIVTKMRWLKIFYFIKKLEKKTIIKTLTKKGLLYSKNKIFHKNNNFAFWKTSPCFKSNF